MKLINLTPHTIRIRVNASNSEASFDASDIEVYPTLPSARVAASVVQSSTLDIDGAEVPLYSQTFGEVENLPEPQEGIAYFVSGLVVSALKAQGVVRPDVVSPIGDPKLTVRDEKGLVYAVRGLV